jgi:hypothetical protein
MPATIARRFLVIFLILVDQNYYKKEIKKINVAPLPELLSTEMKRLLINQLELRLEI